MKYKKQFEGKAKAIVSEAYLFPNFKQGELPKWKFYSPVVAWDTGAECSSISTEVIEALKLKPKGHTEIMVFGGVQEVGIYDISIGLPNGKVFHDVEVFGADLDEYAALFGMDIITKTDFLITNADEKTTFQFRTPSEGGVEL
jgi:hypothetical protein